MKAIKFRKTGSREIYKLYNLLSNNTALINIAVTIKDETGTGKIISSSKIHFPESLVTVKQIIERRVVSEVKNFNNRGKENFYGLIQPVDTEATLNGYKMKIFKPIDEKKQVEAALEAFSQNGFFMLIDNLQVESLEQTFLLHEDSQVGFVKLTPLVGG